MANEFSLHPLLVESTIELAQLPLSTLLLSDDKQYPWFILVPRIANIQDTYQLDWQDQLQLLNESSLLSELLMNIFNGDKMNVAAIGNVCPQLHVHHIIRYKNDIAWPAPVWGFKPPIAYSLEEITKIKAKILPLIEEIIATEK
ncbi:MAG: HIT domain-containing protein [Thalassotalea sp.]